MASLLNSLDSFYKVWKLRSEGNSHVILSQEHLAPTSQLDNKRKLLEIILHVSNVGLIIVINIIYYYTMLGNAGLRMVTPHFILSFLLMLRTVPTRWFFPFLAVFAVLVPAIVGDFQKIAIDEYERGDGVFLKNEVEKLRSHIKYDPTASNPWCNTVLFVNGTSTILWQGVPPGVAINNIRFYSDKSAPYLFGRPEQQPFLAKYIIISGEEAAASAKRYNKLTMLASGGCWVLYQNHIAVCP
ncbi:MAG: hypothetical protein HY795_16435 [Desulfovibrio sp.]|nr:hypothetical protein [Desulfovibrio sp.]MBI4959161.1 hypothetical protein [Desulfovibrio sp.]